ncbi:ataxia telangiectasia mutated [Moniliophthora roreri]|nr:ataxia telangiectasia mutated [Moniliophthora roreri]
MISQSSPEAPSPWEIVFTHAIRRSNTSLLCRAACHAALIILPYSNTFMIRGSRQRILSDIESFLKDLDVQGPLAPHESVCSFLSLCLKAVNQDVRLFRMQFEDKVLSWLTGFWQLSTLDGAMIQTYLVSDISLLLETICGCTKRSTLVCQVLLPHCQTVHTLVVGAQTKIIREFILEAKLPEYHPKSAQDQSTQFSGSLGPDHGSSDVSISSDTDLAAPGPRERRLSGFLLKSIESMTSQWMTLQENNVQPKVEVARSLLNTAIIALSFESVLCLNGIRWDKRLIRSACELVELVAGSLTNKRWSMAEKAQILLALEPLIGTGVDVGDHVPWVALLPAGPGTGIRDNLSRKQDGETNQSQFANMEHLRLLWSSMEVQTCFGNVLITLRSLLCTISGDVTVETQTLDADDKDGFGPIKTTATEFAIETGGTGDEKNSLVRVADICISFIALVPLLQSSSGEPTRDQELIDLLSNCAETHTDTFLLIFPLVLKHVRNRSLNLTTNHLELFLGEIVEIRRAYAYSRNPQLYAFAIQMLDATMHLWASSAAAESEAGNTARMVCKWLSMNLQKQRLTSWGVRDALARLYEKYIIMDPVQRYWILKEDDSEDKYEYLPSLILPQMNSDEDVRVRFRVAVITARLFWVATKVGQSAMELYGNVRVYYTAALKNFEHMVTRILSLGNIMIVSSAVRRGPYWHLLETCQHSDAYSRHLEAILKGAACRMGLPSLATLFEAYASQLAYSIRQGDYNILRLPPHLLGYKDRKECALATFRAFTPTNILGRGNDPNAVRHGQVLFQSHCKAIGKEPEQGLRECFGDIVAYELLSWAVDENGTVHLNPEGIQNLLRIMGCDEKELRAIMREQLDSVVSSILRTLGDHDFSERGPILTALKQVDAEQSSTTFEKLLKYRTASDFDAHTPNLPNFPTRYILVVIQWLFQWVDSPNLFALTYHVLQELFSCVENSHLVNERLRFTNAIALWVALQEQYFKNSTLLHALIRGGSSLLMQADLARSAQAILEWSFARYRENHHRDPRFPDNLIRVACACHRYSQLSGNTNTVVLGKELVSWIDSQASALAAEAKLASQVKVALAAWPHAVPRELTDLSSSLSYDDLTRILNDTHVSSNKFRSVHRLLEHSSSDNGSSQFSHFNFWRLKECIPLKQELGEEDVLAFTSLLLLNQGSVNSFGSEQLGSRVSDVHGSRLLGEAKGIIITSLLSLLESSETRRRDSAYRTLRRLILVLKDNQDLLRSWPSQYNDEIMYLQVYDTPRLSLSAERDLTALQSEGFLQSAQDFSGWVGSLAALFSDILAVGNIFYAQLSTILQSDSHFAQNVLPILVRTILQESAEGSGQTPASHLSTYFSAVLETPDADVDCRRCIIDIVLHLRHIQPSSSNDALAYEKWLTIDHLLLAKNAVICGAYTTALLFLELAEDQRRNQAHVEPSDEYNEAVEQVMYDIYANIDEPDGFYGIKAQNIQEFLMKRFHHEQQWEKAFHFHGAAWEAETSDVAEAEGLLHSFHSYGFDHLASRSLMNSSSVQKPNLSLTYQLGWRTETWDLPDLNDKHCPGASLYFALRSLHRERDTRVSEKVVLEVLFREMDHLRTLGSENIAQIREAVKNLMSLSQATLWMQYPMSKRMKAGQHILEAWDTSIDSGFRFEDLYNIMSTRISLLRSARQREEQQQIGGLRSPFSRDLLESEKQCLLQLSRAARDALQPQIALNSVTRARRLEKPSSDVKSRESFATLEEYASVLWLHQEEKQAVNSLMILRKELPDVARDQTLDIKGAIRGACLNARLGSWTAQACLEKPSYIWDEFFLRASKYLNVNSDESKESKEARASVYHECAIFAEHQYYANAQSPDVIRWKVYMERKVKEISNLTAELVNYSSSSEEYKAINQIIAKSKKVRQQDEEALKKHNEDRDKFLKRAIEMYSYCLNESDEFDHDTPIRLCSLWLANFDNSAILKSLKTALERVPSRKFVFLATVVWKRSTGKSTSLDLSYVFCLKPPRQDENSSRRTSQRHSKAPSPAVQTDRSAAADTILQRLRNDGRVQERLLAMEELCFASLQWADYPVKKNRDIASNKSHDIPGHLNILKLAKCRGKVPVITVQVPIDSTMAYQHCVWIEKYVPKYELVGGISRPKICTCLGSDGVQYKQLFKGEQSDDLRQDAVMEQVFQLVNTVLSRDRETRRRFLQVRDYKVIPLDTQAGVIEFVKGTITVRTWLDKAHPKYRPNDDNGVIKHFGSKINTLKDNNERLRYYLQIRKKFRPVLRYWFMEKHKAPVSWFGMRLNYTRSVATTSIVGHILGLGDRHTSNILLDNDSGEVVHIDLGIAFDQGKLLPVPEVVPFRMTEDMVDGMGMSGTEGVFQRCAEETLRVLREGSEIIMTVLEVFRHDPLHNWTLSDEKLRQVQDPQTNNQNHPTANTLTNLPAIGIGITMDSHTAEEDADRALSSVARKLDKKLSVATVIRGLVAEAKDPANLSRLFGDTAALRHTHLYQHHTKLDICIVCIVFHLPVVN